MAQGKVWGSILSNIIGVIGLLLSVVPIIVSSFGIRRLQADIGTHSSALDFIREDQLRNAYRSYIEDLSYELMVRTAVSSGGPLAGLLWLAALLVAVVAFGYTSFQGAISAGASEGQAWNLLISDSGPATTVLVTSAVVVGAFNCFVQSRLAFLRALYLHAKSPGTQAFKRLVRTAKAYALVLVAPAPAWATAYAMGNAAVRQVSERAAQGLFPTWVLIVLLSLLGLFAWYRLYFPVSASFMSIQRLGVLQLDQIMMQYWSTKFAKTERTPMLAKTFLKALGEPRVDLFKKVGPEGNSPSVGAD